MRRWRRPRFNGNFRGIRFRLAAALAVALAPILVLSAIQSRAAFLQEERRVEQDLIGAASDSARAAQAHINGAVTALQTLRPESVGLYCVARLRDLADNSEHFTALARVNATGRVLCSSTALPVGSVVDQPWFARLREGRAVTLSATPSTQMSDQPAIVAAVRYESPLGRFDGAMAAIVPISTLQPDALEQVEVERVEVALVDTLGRVLAATDQGAFPAAGITPGDLEPALTIVEDARGEQRVLTAAAFAGDDLFVVATAPSQNLFGWAITNALAVFILPLLTWLTALVCVLVVTERVVVRWLGYLERVAAIHARGRHSVRPIHAFEGPAEIRTLAVAMDEMVLAIGARDASLRETLDEKDALMREIHHRVKNNLQVITSLLNMQQRALKDPVARAAMSDMRQRIAALALIYRALYQSETLKQVDVGVFLNDLVSQLMTIERGPGPAVETVVSADPLIVDPDKLAPVALWAVEAISNAQKHAFRERGGCLVVRFHTGPETSTLEVEDDGPGVDSASQSQGLGHTLMTAFARQLRGTTASERGSSGGLRVRLSFPTPEVSLELLTDSAGRRNQRRA